MHLIGTSFTYWNAVKHQPHAIWIAPSSLKPLQRCCHITRRSSCLRTEPGNSAKTDCKDPPCCKRSVNMIKLLPHSALLVQGAGNFHRGESRGACQIDCRPTRLLQAYARHRYTKMPRTHAVHGTVHSRFPRAVIVVELSAITTCLDINILKSIKHHAECRIIGKLCITHDTES